MKPKKPGSDKKPYGKPRLREYGDVRSLTRSVGTTAKNRDVKGSGKVKTG